MATLLRPWRRIGRPDTEDEQSPEAPARAADPSADADHLLVLIPTESGLSFRLLPFPDIDSVHRYVQGHLEVHARQHRVIVFRALHARPAKRAPGTEAAQAVVMVRDPERAGVVDLYSFVTMSAAQSFVRAQAGRGLDLRLVLIYWAAQLPLNAPPAPVAAAAPGNRQTSAAAEQPRRPGLSAGAHSKPARPDAGRAGPASAGAMANGAPRRAAHGAVSDTTTPRSALSRLAARIQGWPGWDGLAPRVVTAALLKQEAYEEVGRDPHATGRARLIVALGILAAGLAAARNGGAGALIHLAAGAAGWAVYAGAVYFVGTAMFPGKKTPGTLTRLLRGLGLAAAPMPLLVLGIVPVYGPLFVLATYIWVLLTTAVAVRPALELDKESAGMTATTGALLLFAVSQVGPMIVG